MGPVDWRRVPWQLRYRTGGRVASDLRRAAIAATHLHCHVEFTGPVRLGPGFSLDIPGGGSFVVGPGVDFRRGFHCEIVGDGRVTIGAGSIFTNAALIQCSTSIDIGERCVFGQSIMLVDGQHNFGDPDRHVLDQGYTYNPIVIGDHVMVTSKCTVMADIGAGAIVGANSVVTRPIPPRCVAVGAPARPIRFFDGSAADPGNPER